MEQPQSLRIGLIRHKAELKAFLANLSDDAIEVLNAVSRYRRSVALLQANGWLNLVLGAFTFWLGYSKPITTILSVGQAILGLVVAATSLFAIVRPITKGIVGFSAIFLLAGVWNVSISLIGGLAGLLPLVFGLGCLQLWWAYVFFRRYQVYAALPMSLPTEEETLSYNNLWASLHNIVAVDGSDPDLISLAIAGRRWRGFLIGDRAVLIPAKQHSILFAQRAEFTNVSDQALNGSVNGVLKAQDINAKFSVPPGFARNFEDWKYEGKKPVRKPAIDLGKW